MTLLDSEQVPQGWGAQDFLLKGTDGKTHSLSDFRDKKGLLVIFTCNHCPYAKAAWPLTIDLYKKYGGDVGFIAINPNDPQTYPEDSMDVMKQKVSEWGIPFAYVVDETQETARAYKAQCTPDPYLFQNEGGKPKLFYHGRINDNWQNPDDVKERNLEDALARLVEGNPAPENQPASMGCSIKWRETTS